MNCRPIPNLSAQDISRLWSHISIANSDDCWLWQLRTDKDGYGKFSIQQSTFRAHRIVFYVYYQIDPLDKLVCHTCDNPTCCNPNHLFIGTERDNTLDARNKGRLNTASGEKHGTKTRPDRVARGEKHSNLTEQQVKDIRSLYTNERWTQQQIANKFGVQREVITSIIRGRTWKHISDVPNISDPKRRGKSGEQNQNAKFTETDIRAIRQKYASGHYTFSSLGRLYGVSYNTIQNIIRKKTWKDVD